jgi:hypothetical protein
MNINMNSIIKGIFEKRLCRCSKCKKPFKKEQLKRVTCHEAHRLINGKENPNGGIRTLKLCGVCFDSGVKTCATAVTIKITRLSCARNNLEV